ncbi:MAG: alkaline phosphatase [Bacteroidales bacterium]|nr:alkaline phosphatase [Bacteroidales bacterium]
MKRLAFMFFVLSMIFNSCGNQSYENLIKDKQETKNVILMIGDGMGVATVHAALTANKGSLNMSRAQVCGFSLTGSANKYVTDSRAGASAIAIGKKANNGSLGIDDIGKAHPNIIELSAFKGMSTGLITSSSILHSTPAAFIVHGCDLKSLETLAHEFIQSPIDLFIGGGLMYFESRADGLDLTQQLQRKGFTVYYDIDEAKPSDKLAVLVDNNNVEEAHKGSGEMMSKSVELALETLITNPDGFLLMVEGSQIEFAGVENNLEYLLAETIDFDEVVGIAFDFADNNPGTLVVVTADHESGGVTILDGNYETGEVEAHFSTDGNTGVMVPVFAYGSGSENFGGIYENTEIFHKVCSLLDLPENKDITQAY